MKTRFLLFLIVVLSFQHSSVAQHSVARQWNEVVLEAIRNDYARPTVHARNLFHTSLAMYDIWAVYDGNAQTFLLGNVVGDFSSDFVRGDAPIDKQAAIEEALSYAVYRIIRHRYSNSPGTGTMETTLLANALMESLGYDTTFTDTVYTSGNPAALGNYVAREIIQFGFQDGANERGNYENRYYEPFNPPLVPEELGNPNIIDLNRWQALNLALFIDQSGNPIVGDTLDFLSPEWGLVQPFALTPSVLDKYQRDGDEYWVYHDPGAPAYIQADGGGNSSHYKWNFSLVSIWSSHLDSANNTMWDISPASLGNVQEYPTDFAGLQSFYNLIDGGDPGEGYDVNPKTNAPYTPQLVKRGDYTRILAEFWADGPSSETPPGHWYTIMNYVHDHPQFERRYQGEGPIVDDLEWDVKAYFTLGGAMHDCAISAWGIKGYYDYIRPVSAIRAMAEKGQSSNPAGLNYSPMGIPLIPGYIEQVQPFEPLSGSNNENVGEIKILAWRGPAAIPNPVTQAAGVGWILAKRWWPYQRPTFVTPPFAGYISGHSTYSRAAAEVLTRITGDEYFPGGMGEFFAPKNDFLVFEKGPTQDITLQWAKYTDASDQCSLSRIWGGIHPPVDDIPGRIIGEKIGTSAFNLADQLFNGATLVEAKQLDNIAAIYPNPTRGNNTIKVQLRTNEPVVSVDVYNMRGQQFSAKSAQNDRLLSIEIGSVPIGSYVVKLTNRNGGYAVSNFHVVD